MNCAPLDPADTIVLFADLQAGIIERAATIYIAHLRRAVSALAKLAQLFRHARGRHHSSCARRGAARHSGDCGRARRPAVAHKDNH